ncbi:MAG: (deoxy)nucleoside triphosphate pyrophosphohydrolase [Opitutales bacterium]
MNPPRWLPVVCAVLFDPKGKVLAAQRPAGKSLGLMWEFPGGKVEVGESPERALRREIAEELGVTLGALEPLVVIEHRYEFEYVRLEAWRGRCDVRPTIELREHIDAKWIDLTAWRSLPWAPADVPVIEYLLRLRQAP